MQLVAGEPEWKKKPSSKLALHSPSLGELVLQRWGRVPAESCRQVQGMLSSCRVSLGSWGLAQAPQQRGLFVLVLPVLAKKGASCRGSWAEGWDHRITEGSIGAKTPAEESGGVPGGR